jgi:hypothetical protein
MLGTFTTRVFEFLLRSKMLIKAYNGENMLTAKRSNPEVIARDRPSLPLKFQDEGAYDWEVSSSMSRTVTEEIHSCSQFSNSMPGLGNPKTVSAAADKASVSRISATPPRRSVRNLPRSTRV